MKHAIRTLLASIALLAAPFATAARAEAPAAVPQTASKQLKPALWKVADADTTIYLFGTIHALPKGLVWLDGPVAKALEGSDELVTEIPVLAPGEQQKAVMEHGRLSGETLRSLMSDTDRGAYESLLAKLGIPAEAFDTFKPWLAGVTIGILPYQMAGYGPADGVEAVLHKAALAKGKKLGALETVDFQLGLFDQLPREVQLRFLNDAVREFDRSFAVIGSMTDTWGTGDAEALGKLMNEEMDDPALAETLLFQRNRTWANWIHKRLATPGTVFIAVGAGHLAGPESVQDALRKQGIASTRVQ